MDKNAEYFKIHQSLGTTNRERDAAVMKLLHCSKMTAFGWRRKNSNRPIPQSKLEILKVILCI